MEGCAPGEPPWEYEREHINALIYIDFTIFAIQGFELTGNIIHSHIFVNNHICDEII